MPKSQPSRISRNKKLRQRVVRAARDYYWFGPGDELMVDAVLSIIATRKWRTYPCWLMIMAPPGSGKTDLISRLDHPNVLSVSQMTPASLASGWRGSNGEDKSLLAIANDKIVIVKDFTTILTAPRESRDAIIGIFRDSYDGSHAKAYGTVGLIQYKTHFTVIAAVTPAYEHYYSVIQQLGERFVIFRMRAIDPLKVTAASLHNMRNERSRLDELNAALNNYVGKLRLPALHQLHISGKFERQLIHLATFVAGCRTHVHRSGSRGIITASPEKETAGRLVRQLAQVAFGRAVSCGRITVNHKDMELATRIAADCIPTVAYKIIQAVYELNRLYSLRHPTAPDMWFCNPAEVRRRTKLGLTTVQRRLGDLEALDMVDVQGQARSAYKLKDSYRRIIQELDLWSNKGGRA